MCFYVDVCRHIYMHMYMGDKLSYVFYIVLVYIYIFIFFFIARNKLQSINPKRIKNLKDAMVCYLQSCLQDSSGGKTDRQTKIGLKPPSIFKSAKVININSRPIAPLMK